MRILMVATALATAIAASAAAGAADIPASTATRASLALNTTVRGTFESNSDTDWYRVSLVKGRDYVVVGWQGEGDTVILGVHDARGRRIASLATICDHDWTCATEFVAPADGTHFIAIKTRHIFPGDTAYSLEMEEDCARSAKTRCSSPVGQTYGGRWQYLTDHDWRRITLQAGRRYTARFLPNDCYGGIRIVDRASKVIASNVGLLPTLSSLSFRASYSGQYYIDLVHINDGSRQSCLAPYQYLIQ